MRNAWGHVRQSHAGVLIGILLVGIGAACGGAIQSTSDGDAGLPPPPPPEPVDANRVIIDPPFDSDRYAPPPDDTTSFPDIQSPPPPPDVDGGGGPILLDGGDAGLVQCVVGGFAESEPNDTEQSATPYPDLVGPGGVSTACGNVSASDLDWLRFELPVGTASYNLDWTGSIGFMLTINGTTIVYPGATMLPPVDTEHTYFLQVNATAATPWTMTLRAQ